jgi:hypothetical protein
MFGRILLLFDPRECCNSGRSEARDVVRSPHRDATTGDPITLKLFVSIWAVSLTLHSCGYVADHVGPRRELSTTRTAAASRADDLF